MMKKLISLLLCAVMLLSCVPFAQAETQPENGSAVDIVLLIDQSGSTWNGGTSGASDPNGNRLDAAQMVIALLGMNGSRVAYVPFAARVFENADDSFHTINGAEDYRAKMAECERLRTNPEGTNNENRGGTDFAEALAYAYNLLANRRPNENNQPMIILLTDGSLTLEDSDKQERITKPYYVWNAQTERFDDTDGNVMVYESRRVYNRATYYADELLEQAVVACAHKDYPVYSVALDADTASEHYVDLNSISIRTGADNAVAISKNDSSALEQLPAYFARMFASRIGSSELVPLETVCVDPATNLYEVKFVIPNDSVMEANLFVSKEGLVGSPELLDKDNNHPNSSTMMELSSENFVLYKLTNPRPFGIWKLRFQMKEGRTASDISFNLLYNYDVVLKGYVGTDIYAQDEGGQTFQRGDSLVFSGKFFDVGEGRLSTDVSLYQYPEDPNETVDDEFVMRATYSLSQVSSSGTMIPIENGSGTMEVNGAQFYKELDMKTLVTDAEGNNTIAAGDYIMEIRVEGCGLERDVQIPFTLANTPPSNAANSIPLFREVDGDDESTHAATPMYHYVNAYVVDNDNDKIISEFVQTSGQEVITLSYDAAACAIISTPIQRADGKLAYGTATGELKVREVMTGVETVIPVTMNVMSGNDTLTRRWNMRVTADGVETGSVQEKNTSFDIKLEMLLTENGRVDRTDMVDKVTAKIEIVDVNTNNVVANGTMTLGEDKVFTYTHTTGVNAGKWAVTVSTFQDELPIKVAQTDFSVENEKPAASIASETHVIYHNPLPEFLSFLGEVTSEAERTLDLNTYFTENDNEPLSFILQQEPNANLLTIAQNDGVWVMTAAPDANSKTEFKVIARDNDGETTTAITFEVELIDLVQVWTQRGLMALAALAVLIILIMIIRQSLKPKFPRCVLGVREGSSDYDTSTYELVPSKKPITLAAVVMTDTAAKFGINANALTNIELVPVRTVNGSIGVRTKKKLDDVTISLSSKSIGKGKKPTVWPVGDSLILNSRNNTTGAELNVVLFPPEDLPVVGGGTSLDEDPFQVNDASGFGGFNSDVNAFGANDVSGSFGGLAPTDNFGPSTSSADSSFSMPSGDDNGAGDGFSADNGSNDDFTIGF